MKTATPQLAAFLASAKQGLHFDLWTITLASGTVQRWTDADVDLACFASRASVATYFDAGGVLRTAALNEARYGFDPVTHASLGLLLEAAATNLCPVSVPDASWVVNVAGGTPAYGIAPDGTKTTYRTPANGAYAYKQAQLTAGVTTTYSIFVKCAATDSLHIYIDGNWGAAGAFSSAQASFVTPAAAPTLINAAAASCVPCGPGLYRLSLTFTPVVSALGACYVYPNSANPQEWWGAQCEVGTQATSYIATTGAAATRAADVANTFARGPVITRDRVSWVRGIEVDQLRVQMRGPTVTVDGQQLPTFAAAGGLDGAWVQLDRAYLNDAGNLQGVLAGWFGGQVADVYPGRMGCDVVVKSQLAQLTQQLPRNVYQAACLNDLYDSQCGVNRAAYQLAGTVQSASPGYLALAAATPLPDRWLELGIVKFTSGANAGLSRTIVAQSGNGTNVTIQIARPFPFPIAAGDAFTAWPGCDKTQGACAGKFNNIVRFRGLPYVPAPETVT